MRHSSLIEKIDSLIRFFIYILIFWLPYSSAVIENCVISGLILWFIKRGVLVSGRISVQTTLKGRLFGCIESFRPESTFLNKPIAIFLMACFLSVAGSSFFAQSLHNFFTKTLEWFVVYFLIVEVFKEKRHIYIALIVFMFTAFSTVLDGLVQFHITGKDIFMGYLIDVGSRATAGFRTPNGLGGYLTAIVPGLLAWVFLAKQNLRDRLAASTILFFTTWALIDTFSRGAWVGTLFSGMFLLLLVLFSKKRLNFYFYLSLFGMAMIFLMGFYLVLTDSISQEQLVRPQTIQWRIGIWSTSIEIIKDKFFFGHGINTFMRIFQSYRGNFFMDPTYAHNCYIQLAVETGLIGLLCFFWMIFEMFFQSLKKIKSHFVSDRNLAVLIISLLSGILAFLVHSFFDTNFYSLQLSVYLWLMVGMLVAIYKISDVPAVQRGSIS